ncbi:MAG: DUF393 domain-containing protein [Amylibacter sp.]
MTYSSRNTPPKVKIFYDGSCPLCLAEIGYYKRADTNDDLCLIDVSSDEFLGDVQITQQAAMARFHVRMADGQQVSGARGFVEVWRVIPSWNWLAKITSVPGAVPVLEILYRVFLRARPLIVTIFKSIRRTTGQHKKSLNSNSEMPPK